MKVVFDIKVTGKLGERLNQLKTRLGTRVEKGLYEAGDLLLKESKKLVPIDTKVLYNTSVVRQEGYGFNTVVVVGYGPKGYSEYIFSPHENKFVDRVPYEYAAEVHENDKVQHPVGQAFYLEEPLNDAGIQLQMRTIIVSAMT